MSLISAGSRVIGLVLTIAFSTWAQQGQAAKGMSSVSSEKGAFEQQTKVALLVGIANYPESSGFSKLRYPGEDVSGLAAELRSQGYTVRALVDADATRGIVRKALREMSEILSADQGTLLFYFSGHGFEQDNQNFLAVYGSVADDLKGEGLPLQEVINLVNKSPARRKVMFIDACRNDPTSGRQLAIGRSFKSLSDAEGVRILYSAKPGGVSFEDPKIGHGVFTYFLIRGFHGEAKSLDGLITFQDLAQFVRESVKSFGIESGKMQIPFDSGEGAGDFLLGKSTSIPGMNRKNRLLGINADAVAREGLMLAKEQKYRESVEAFTKAIEARVEPSAEEHYYRGLSYLHIQQYQLAVDDFSAALEVGGESAEVYDHRGYAYAAIKEYDRAIPDFSQALGLKPDDTTALLNRGRAFLERSEFDKATADFNKVVELQPNAAVGYRGRATVHLSQMRPDLAVRDLTRAIEVDSEKPDSYVDRGNAFVELGDADKALSDYDAAIERQADFVPAYERRGRLYIKLADYRKAVSDYTEAIRLDPSLGSAYANRAFALAVLKDYKGAIDDCNRAIERDPYLPEAFNNRGYAYAGQRNYSAASQDYDRAIKLKNDFAEAYENRAAAEKALGDTTGAKSDIEKARSFKKRETPLHSSGSRVA